MRIKELFTVPEGTKVTEKRFGKVLLSSVCGILLCMACLVSTTWAWFTVSIDNTGNEIQIAKVTADITINGIPATQSEEGGYVLEAGTQNIEICLNNSASGSDDLNRRQNDVYAVMTVTYNGETKSYYCTFAGKPEAVKQLLALQIGNGTATVSFSVSWVKPASATPVGSEAVVIGAASTGSEPTPSTEVTTTTQQSVPETTESVIAPTKAMTVVG